MDLSPQHLRKVEFRERWRGYDPDEVDDYLERVAAVFELLQERLRVATDRAAEAESRARESEGDSLRKTLVLAQRTADTVEQEARAQATRLVAEAEEQAAAIVAEAEATARQRIEEGEAALRGDVAALEAVRAGLEADVEAFERFIDEARAEVGRVLRVELDRVDRLAPHLGPRPTPRDVQVPAAPFGAFSGEGDEEGGTVEVAGEDGPVTGQGRLEEAGAVEADEAHEVEREEGPPASPEAPEEPVAPDTVDYFAYLREAMADGSPLGPRDEEDEGDAADEPAADDLFEPGGFRSMLRRDRE